MKMVKSRINKAFQSFVRKSQQVFAKGCKKDGEWEKKWWKNWGWSVTMPSLKMNRKGICCRACIKVI
jgi:hypothetical protein